MGARSNEEQDSAGERMRAPDHPETLTTRYNLANRRGQAGDLVGAITALEQLVTDQSRIPAA